MTKKKKYYKEWTQYAKEMRFCANSRRNSELKHWNIEAVKQPRTKVQPKTIQGANVGTKIPQAVVRY